MIKAGRMRANGRGGRRGAPGAVGAVGLVWTIVQGCDAQADPTYTGEPLVTVSGRVESQLTLGEVEVGVLWLTTGTGAGCSDVFELVCTGEASAGEGPSACAEACGELTCATVAEWEACIDACPDVTFTITNVTSDVCFTGGVGQTTPAVGEFPAQFSLDIVEPPPDEALITAVTGERLAYGVLVAVDPSGAPWRLDLRQLPDLPDWLLGGSESHFLLYAPEAIPESSEWTAALGFSLRAGYQLMEVVTEVVDDEEVVENRPVRGGDASQVRLTIAAPEALALPLPIP